MRNVCVWVGFIIIVWAWSRIISITLLGKRLWSPMLMVMMMILPVIYAQNYLKHLVNTSRELYIRFLWCVGSLCAHTLALHARTLSLASSYIVRSRSAGFDDAKARLFRFIFFVLLFFIFVWTPREVHYAAIRSSSVRLGWLYERKLVL